MVLVPVSITFPSCSLQFLRLRPSGVVKKHSDMVKNMVKQRLSNPASHSKLAINIRKKLNWSKDRGDSSGQHEVGVV